MNRPLFKAAIAGFLSLLIMLSFGTSLWSQEVTGLWEIIKVAVGQDEMTPQSKWVKLEPSGEYSTGNGWLRTGMGNWSLDQGYIEVVETDGLYDPFGPFSVEIKDGQMVWSRDEEGAQVEIFLKKVAELPKGPADLVTGIWRLKAYYLDTLDKTKELDPESKYFLFLRWDRIYVSRDQHGQRQTGYWHMNGHRPELTLLPHAKGGSPGTWTVSFRGDDLIITGASDSNIGQQMILVKTDRFPE